MLLKDIIDISIIVKLDNDLSTSFWLDRWIVYCNLANFFSSLYEIAQDKVITASQVFSSTNLKLLFTRQLVGVHLNKWT